MHAATAAPPPTTGPVCPQAGLFHVRITVTTTKRANAPTLTGEPFEDTHGTRCFRVPLSGRDGAGLHALVDLEGIQALQKAGAKSLYLASDGQGRSFVTFLCVPTHKAMTAARAILGDPRGRRIEYRSGNRLDLRAANLWARPYANVGDCRAAT